MVDFIGRKKMMNLIEKRKKDLNKVNFHKYNKTPKYL